MPTTSPRALLVGPFSIDVFVDRDRSRPAPGGAVAYAARAAAALGERLAILTVGSADADLGAFDGHDLHLIETARTLSFELRATSEGRRLRLLQRNGHTLHAADLPPGWAQPRLLILAPLLPDGIDLASFDVLPTSTRRLVIAQGLQRTVDASSAIAAQARPSSALLRAATPHTSLVLSHSETSLWSAAHFDTVTARAAHLIVTRGSAGADVYTGGQPPLHVDACRAEPVDTTGAGDVFAAAFALTLDHGVERAAAVASACAAAAVEVRGPAPLPSRASILRRAAAVAEVGRP